MKCILARQTLVAPLSPPALSSPKAEQAGDATSIGRMRAESHQKQLLKEERRQLELMREEVIKNRIRRQTEAAAAELHWKKSALGGPATAAGSKKESTTLQYFDGVKMRTFRTAKLATVSRPSNAYATAVPVHSQAGALLRQIGSPKGATQP